MIHHGGKCRTRKVSRRVFALRRADCRELVTVCRAKGLKVGTVRGIVRTLSTILSQAVEDELGGKSCVADGEVSARGGRDGVGNGPAYPR